MENASKALLMAGGLLIGIMVVSIFVYVFSSYSTRSAQIDEKIHAYELTQQTNKYLKYTGSDTNSIYDVVTAANQAMDDNKNLKLGYNPDGGDQIRVIVNGIDTSDSGVNTTNLSKLNADGSPADAKRQENLNKLIGIVLESDKNASATKGIPVSSVFSCNIESSNGKITRIVFTWKDQIANANRTSG